MSNDTKTSDKYDVRSVRDLTPDVMRKLLLRVAERDHDLFNDLVVYATYLRGGAS